MTEDTTPSKEDVEPRAETTGNVRCSATTGDGDPCERWAVYGEGKCPSHLGMSLNSGGAEHYDNTNAVRHGLYAQDSTFYQDVATDGERELINDIFADYLEQYREKHGDVPTGHEAKLFQITVNIVKEYYADRWITDRPDEEDSGNALVDAEVNYSESGERYITHKETPSLKALKKLSNDTRMWLAELGLTPTSNSGGGTTVVGLMDLFAALPDDDESEDADAEDLDTDTDNSDLEDSDADGGAAATATTTDADG